jgi:hypothetical protein
MAVKDSSWIPISTIEVVSYAPRALANALFAPFPRDWFASPRQSISVFYSVASVESMVFYVAFLGLPLLLVRGGNHLLIWGILLPSAFVLLIYGLGVPFLGALYRYRYPFWMLLLSLGLASWLQIVLSQETVRKTFARWMAS